MVTITTVPKGLDLFFLSGLAYFKDFVDNTIFDNCYPLLVTDTSNSKMKTSTNKMKTSTNNFRPIHHRRQFQKATLKSQH